MVHAYKTDSTDYNYKQQYTALNGIWVIRPDPREPQDNQ